MMQKELYIADIGSVALKKLSRAVNMQLHVDRTGKVYVTMPMSLTYAEAESFVNENIGWIQERLTERRAAAVATYFTPKSTFAVRDINLSFQVNPDEPSLAYHRTDANVVFTYNPNLDFHDELVQDFIRDNILQTMKYVAIQILPPRLESLAAKFGLRFTSFKIGTAYSRLGSCSSDNGIILSARLIVLPDYLIDYVIMHELCHIRYKNHGPEFRAQLNEMSGNKSKQYEEEIRQYHYDIRPVPAN